MYEGKFVHTTLLRLWPLITIVKATYACECDESKPMNPQELLALNDFLKQLSDVRGVQKDAQVDLLINQAVAQQPDAAEQSQSVCRVCPRC